MVDDAQLAPRLRITVMRLARRLRQENPAGITPSQLSVLANLFRSGPVSLSEVAASERVKPPTVTRIVAALEAEGLVVREVDPADRRSARIGLTDSGRKLVASVRRRRDAFLSARLRRLDSDQLDTLAAAIDLLDGLLEDTGT